MTGKIFIISAPCGAGKSSLVAAAIDQLKGQWPIEQVITYTTRNPRQNERNGHDYNFIDSAEFERHIASGFFLEWSNAYTAYYGSPRSIINESKKGTSFMLIVDRVGAQKIITQIPDAILIWIEVTLADLEKRLLKRATESRQQIKKRLAQSQIEIKLEEQKPLYHYRVINDDFKVATAQLVTIIGEQLNNMHSNLGDQKSIQKSS